MTGIYGDAVRCEACCEGHGQHAIGLFRLAISRAIGISSSFEFEIRQVEIAGPVTGHVDHPAAAAIGPGFPESIRG